MTRIVTAFILAFVTILPAHAELRIDITQGTFRPIPIAIPSFEASSNSTITQGFAQQIPDVITNDLASSGLFRPVDRRAFLQGNGQYLTQPNFQDWRIIHAEALVVGRITDAGHGRINIEFRLFDVFGQRQLEGISMTGNQSDWRRLAHKVADRIYERITGEKGYFDTRILYVAENGIGKDRKTRLAVMDQDGENHG